MSNPSPYRSVKNANLVKDKEITNVKEIAGYEYFILEVVGIRKHFTLAQMELKEDALLKVWIQGKWLFGAEIIEH